MRPARALITILGLLAALLTAVSAAPSPVAAVEAGDTYVGQGRVRSISADGTRILGWRDDPTRNNGSITVVWDLDPATGTWTEHTLTELPDRSFSTWANLSGDGNYLVTHGQRWDLTSWPATLAGEHSSTQFRTGSGTLSFDGRYSLHTRPEFQLTASRYDYATSTDFIVSSDPIGSTDSGDWLGYANVNIGITTAPWMSHNGEGALFMSTSGEIGPQPDPYPGDIELIYADIAAGELVNLSRIEPYAYSSAQNVAISGDGSTVVFTGVERSPEGDTGRFYHYDTATGARTAVPWPDYLRTGAAPTSITADGSHVIVATSPLENDLASPYWLMLIDLVNNTFTPLDLLPGERGDKGILSADGSTFAWETQGTNPNTTSSVYVRDLGITNDTDNDGVYDYLDVCPTIADPGQDDFDGDGIGDACENDTLAPNVAAALTPAPNAAGWANQAITITWSATDPEPSAGMAAVTIPDTLADLEGIHTYTSAQVCDIAGNCATGEAVVSIDYTPPVVELDSPDDGGTVLVDNYVAPTCVASDPLSGLDGECSIEVTDPVDVPGGYTLTATATATDVAGNTTEVSATYTVLIDIDAPEITASPDRPATVDGWWDGPVTFTFDCTDAQSGVATCPTPALVTTEGAGQSIEVEATDNAGNIGTLVVGGINIDATDPEITYTLPQATFDVTDTIEIGCAVTDDLSGLADATCPGIDGVTGLELGVGVHTLTATATDRAGNTSTVTVTFEVVVTTDSYLDLAMTYLSNAGLVNALAQELDGDGSLDVLIAKLDAQCCSDGDNPKPKKRLTVAEHATLVALAEELLG